MGGGSVAYCGSNNKCHTATKDFKFQIANGVVKGHDSLYYVAHSLSGKITVFTLQPDQTLLPIDEIKIGMVVGNLSIDTNGDIFVAAIPWPLSLIQASKKPLTTNVPSTIFRIRKLKNGNGAYYEVQKILEDIEGEVLPGATTVVHDTQTGTIFLGGITSPFLTVCERQSTD